MEAQTREEYPPPAVLVQKPRYRDELNFAEFPLASLADRLPPEQKTLVFTDTIWDQGQKKPVSRTLTISASDKYGLPTALDDEVILGLVQLSNGQKFESRTVHFTRYELIKLLGWKDRASSYERVAQSLNRWLGVTLYYEKAWWSKEEQCWVSESFHILDKVTIFDRERRDRRVRSKRDDPTAGQSSFVWNEVVFESFLAGNLKAIDFEAYKRLTSAIAKRMFRFLDKRFWHTSRLEFDLRNFACEHVGLSKEYHNGEIKRRLAPALKELEEVGFLKLLSPEERYVKVVRGEWKIVLVKQSAGRRTEHEEPSNQGSALVEVLVERGISRKRAGEVVAQFPAERIREKVALHDWLLKGKERAPKNPPGFLLAAIEEDYALPPELAAKDRPQGREEGKGAARRPARKWSDTAPGEGDAEERLTLDAFWNDLTDTEREAFEAEAVRMTDKFLAGQYHAGKAEAGTLFKTVRQAIIDQHIRRKLGLANAA